jgi:hypothetical protein
MAVTSADSQDGSEQANQQNGGQNAEAAASGGSSSPSKLDGPALWVAIFALAVWVAFSVVLFFSVGKNETEWTRIAWIFGSIQSIAFAAAGALFGTAVQQQNVSSARQEAATAKKEADQQRDMATKGCALATVVQAEGITPKTGDTNGVERMGPGRAGTTESAEAVRQRHAQLAQSLFGNLVEPH